MRTAPDLSVVVEWENVMFSERTRAVRMLGILRKQAEAIDRTVEVIVVFDANRIDRADVETYVYEHAEQRDREKSVEWRVEAAEASHYYELKNEGARRSRGQVVIFLDSDVVPEDDWLKGISAPFFASPEIAVLAGHTSVAHESTFEKAFALGWFFPLRDPDNVIHSNRQRFFANNVAFRRDVILNHPFPVMPEGATRGACGDLARTLSSSGVRIWTNTAARAQHPPPSNPRHFVVRALAHGRDIVVYETEAGHTLLEALRRSLRWSCTYTIGAARRMKSEGHEVGLRFWQLPAALCIMICFYCLAFLAGCATALFPDYARRHWRI